MAYVIYLHHISQGALTEVYVKRTGPSAAAAVAGAAFPAACWLLSTPAAAVCCNQQRFCPTMVLLAAA
jgi:hypothetical protein